MPLTRLTWIKGILYMCRATCVSWLRGQNFNPSPKNMVNVESM